MKTRILLSLLLFALSVNNICAQNNIKSQVEESAEILSIIWRLIGSPEYAKRDNSTGLIKKYDELIDSHFSAFKDHDALRIAKECRNNGIGYGDLMVLAIHLNKENGRFVLNNEIDIYLKKTDNKRWNGQLEAFVGKLNGFYKDTNFSDFFNSCKYIYTPAEESMRQILQNYMNLSWFTDFYGVAIKDGTFNVVISMVNGPQNYGLKVIHNDKTETLYAVLGCHDIDSDGNPCFFPVIKPIFLSVHEFSHSFCNPLIYDNDEVYKEFEKSGEIIFPLIEEKIKAQGYSSWRDVQGEAIVRACVINYFKKSPELSKMIAIFGLDLIGEEVKAGYFWMEDLVKKLDEYDQNRDIYPTLESFIPQIVDFYNKLAADTQKKNQNK
ncbi:DUF4932 domain-containing protein [Prevotella sp. 10(H)]|uniref:DUF4932 domain-containing protein n=1 Tax=Prevotella sp. 10(H) TaxID=1158294 RepID=UPI0004A6B4CC|nr:DUF4932 domain-containing protein [Prevotella sp. 10(H)]